MANTRRAAHFENDREWNEVWDEYDRRKAALAVADRHGAVWPRPDAASPGHLATARSMPRRERRARGQIASRIGGPTRRPGQVLGRAMAGTLLPVIMLAGLWAALPWLLAMQVTAALRSPDPVALMRQTDPLATAAGLREALLAEVPAGLDGGAGRWVADLAGRMAAAAEAGGSAEWITLRATARDASGLPRLEVLRDLRTVGPALFQLDYGPERGSGGIRFDVAWQGSGFRVVGVRSLDAPPRELPRRWPGGQQVAMR